VRSKCSRRSTSRLPVTVTKTSPRTAASTAGRTSKPSIRASSARIGSTSHTITVAPAPRARSAIPRPVAPYPSTTMVWPATKRLVARRMPSSADCPVPKRSLKARSDAASLTARIGNFSRPARSIARRPTRPDVVSSVPPMIPSASSSAAARSAPSSSVTCGLVLSTGASCGSRSPRSAWAPIASTTSGCTVSGFAEHNATDAPPASSVSTSTAVSAVTCRQAPTRTSASGRSAANRSRIEPRTGIRPRAQSMRSLVAIVIRLEGALDRHADVRGLLGAQRRQLRAERVEVQPRDLLVEVLGQHVDLVLVLVVLREQLDLGDRLVRERVGHHERGVAGRVAEVQQAALGQQQDRMAVGEPVLVHLRLDVDPLGDLLQPGHVDLVVEVADVADDRLVLHPR